MGTINYKTSDFITLGYNCDFIDYDDKFYNEIIQDYFDQIENKLKQQHFYYFHITIEPGYYEGYSINIENNFPVCLDGWEDRKQAQKEITRIKAFLIECVNDFELYAVFPGWCTTYLNYNETLKKLTEAVLEMRETVKETPTYNKYIRNAKK